MEAREQLLAAWDRAAPGWRDWADRVREFGMPVSAWMIEQLALQPSQRVLELAAGPGDTGFLAAELVQPGGVLLSSDGSDAMLEVARERARAMEIKNVEFRRLELEWIDLDTASVDAVLCRWGLMLCLDPATALREIRRVLASGGRAAFAVWDRGELNPWATIPGKALVELGHSQPPDPSAPGMFALSAPGQLQEMLQDAGFVDVRVEAIDVDRAYPGVEAFLTETAGLSRAFREVYESLAKDEREQVAHRIASLAQPYTAADGCVRLPGRSLVAAASG